MSDEELGQVEEAVEEEAPTGATEPTGSKDQDRQPEDDRRVSLDDINLDDVPAFRKWKSQTDSRLAQAERAAQQAEAARRQAEQERIQAHMQGMDEAEKLAFQNQLLQQQLAQMEQQRQFEMFNYRRQQDLLKISSKLGVDPDELIENLPQGADSFVAWEVAYDLAAKKGTANKREARRADPVRQEANKVDLGGGKPSVAATEYERMLQRALEENDASALIDSWAAAAQAGVELRE